MASAEAAPPCFAQLPARPGIPQWGFSTGPPLTAHRGGYARAYGSLDVATRQISGRICQVHYVHARPDLVVLIARSPILEHTHFASVQGHPANELAARVSVISSTDPGCRVHSTGTMTILATYDGVRDDFITLSFPAACHSQDSRYQGSQIKAVVPAA